MHSLKKWNLSEINEIRSSLKMFMEITHLERLWTIEKNLLDYFNIIETVLNRD